MKLQNLTVIFIIIIIPIILLVSLYITTGLKTLKYQSLYDTGLLTATHDAIFAFEQNTSNDEYSNNPEIKRDILKSSIKMFEKSLANTCGISSYNVEEIEEYIPAIVFGMYDGFYMYAPSKELVGDDKYEYKHNLKNYVYYSETLDDGTVIRYSLDNYVVVTGIFKDENGNDVYQTRGGYLAAFEDTEDFEEDGTYQGISIIEETNLSEHSKDGINYYQEAYDFTNWFLNKAKMGDKAAYFKINEKESGKFINDPEDENSAFVQHKRSIMKSKIEGVLNSSITAYSQRTWDKVYKMPKLSEEDWQKIYSNISMITFFQGKNIGLTKYNGYCVLNSTNSREYVNPNLMYFIGPDGYYHDIRCTQLSDQTSGYRIGKYEKIKVEQIDENGVTKVDDNGNVLYKYVYEHNKLACYDCINGPLQNNVSLYDYVRTTATDTIKKSYFTSLGRERYNGSKPISYIPTQNELESGVEQEYISITGRKLWIDDSNRDGKRPSDIKLQLYKNGFAMEGSDYIKEIDITVNEYTYTWQNLPKYDEDGNEITYTVKEIGNIAEYTVDTWKSGNTITIQNSRSSKTISKLVNKIWDDNNNQDGKRDSYTIILKANNAVKAEVTLSSDVEFYEFNGLYKYENGEEIDYTIEEDVPDGYVAEINDDGDGNTFTITNKHTPETTSRIVEKVWEHGTNEESNRPTSVTVKLMANGRQVGESVALSTSNDWSYTWNNLAKYSDGEEITYTLIEDSIPSYIYNVEYENNNRTFKLTNTYLDIIVEDYNSSVDSSKTGTRRIQVSGWYKLTLISGGGRRAEA